MCGDPGRVTMEKGFRQRLGVDERWEKGNVYSLEDRVDPVEHRKPPYLLIIYPLLVGLKTCNRFPIYVCVRTDS